jgi:hypothetical protein
MKGVAGANELNPSKLPKHSWTDEVSCFSKEVPNFFTCNVLYNLSFRRQVLLSYIDGLDVFAKKQSHQVQR